MTNHQLSSAQLSSAQLGMTRRHQQGFTLVEIGVVLVIIGLLLGAVLKGQELIASARVSNLISNMNGYKAAINAFEDRYRIVPGDSSTAATKVGNGAVNCTILCDDRIIYGWANANLVNNHLLAAGFYSGPALPYESSVISSEKSHLSNPGGGPIYMCDCPHFLTSNGAWSTIAIRQVITGWNLSSKLLGEVDRKIDDGNGWTGGVRAGLGHGLQANSGCVSATTGTWIENDPGTNCLAVELFP
jgi:prepilin-type N-terminal cleavage/methylation domain-containing protein